MRITREQAVDRGLEIDDSTNPPTCLAAFTGEERASTFTVLETHLMTQLRAASGVIKPSIPDLAAQFDKVLELAFQV